MIPTLRVTVDVSGDRWEQQEYVEWHTTHQPMPEDSRKRKRANLF
jgi:hypothetical protein